MIRKSLSVLFATVFLSAGFASVADAATNRTKHRTRASHATMHRGAKARPVTRDAGSASTDALNQQSLNAARGGAAQ